MHVCMRAREWWISSGTQCGVITASSCYFSSIINTAGSTPILSVSISACLSSFFSSIFCSITCSRHSHGDHIPPQTPPVSKAGVSFCWLALYRNSCLLNNSPHTYVAVLPFKTVPSLPTCTAQKSRGIVLHPCKHVRGLWYFCTFQLVAIFSMFAALTFDRKGRTCYKKTRLNVSRLLAEPLASEHFNNCLN